MGRVEEATELGNMVLRAMGLAARMTRLRVHTTECLLSWGWLWRHLMKELLVESFDALKSELFYLKIVMKV